VALATPSIGYAVHRAARHFRLELFSLRVRFFFPSIIRLFPDLFGLGNSFSGQRVSPFPSNFLPAPRVGLSDDSQAGRQSGRCRFPLTCHGTVPSLVR